MPPPLFAAPPTRLAEFRLVLLPLVAGAVAIYFLLPRPVGRQLFYGAVLGILALVLAGLFVVDVGGVSVETVLFYIFSGLAVVSGTLLITQYNPARAALSFTLVVLNVCGLFLLLAAPFLMVATIIIYAGAIVVTFLFVLMLAQQSGRDDADLRSREPLLASLTGFVLLGALLYVLRLGFHSGTKDLDPFLARIRAAKAQETAEEMDRALNQNPKELDEAVERLRQDNGSKLTSKDLAAVLAEADFATRLRRAVDLLGLTDLKNRLEDDTSHFTWPALPPPEADEKMRFVLKEKMRTVLNEYEALVQAARQRVGLVQPDAADGPYLSRLSGPPSSATGELRRDDTGRPQAPAENAAHLGRALFTDYLLPVELSGFLLLIATVGAIAIANRHNTRRAP
jgi:NADH:ubiquinone oxidoreductase subunit 6 (subunit J)